MTNNGEHVIDHPGPHGEAGGQSSSEEMGRYGGGSSSSEEDNGGRGWGNYGGMLKCPSYFNVVHY